MRSHRVCESMVGSMVTLVAFGLGASIVWGQQVHNLTQGTDHDTIQGAISDAFDGDEIEVDPGTYVENIDFLGLELTIRSTDPLDPGIVESTIIDGGGVSTVVILSAGEVSGFTIINGIGQSFNAGGVHATGTAMVTHNFITGNIANAVGGGVTAEDTVRVSNNQIAFNVGANRGGGVNARHNSLIIDNFIAFNSATSGGGGVRAREDCTIRNNTIVSNLSEDTGGGIVGGGGILAEDNSVVLSNIISFSTDGVGIHVPPGDPVTADFNCVFGNFDGEYSGGAVAGANDLSVNPTLDADSLHLLDLSPCIHAGDPALVPVTDETDIDGQARIDGGRVDIGADEAADCNGSGIGDATDIAGGTSTDCTDNGIPDECDFEDDETLRDCNANAIPDSCDVAGGTSVDCNENGAPDECDLALFYSAVSENFTPLGSGFPHVFTLFAAPEAGSDVGFSFAAIGDFNGSDEFIEVDINGTVVGTVYATGADQCPVLEDFEVLVVPQDTYNAAVAGGNAVITMTASEQVTAGLCVGERITLSVAYDLISAPVSEDCNDNAIPDECDIAGDTSTDCNGNAIPDDCDLDDATSGDCNNNSVPDECEVTMIFSALSGELGPFGGDVPRSFTLFSTPEAVSDVEFTFNSSADLDSSSEFVEVDINGTAIGTIFESGATQCADDPGDEASLTISAATYNSAVGAGPMVINMVASGGVNVDLCTDSFIAVSMVYDAGGEPSAEDCNANDIPDECDVSEGTSADTNSNGIPDECEDMVVHNITQDTDFFTIQAAIDDAVSGDEIEVDAVTFFENIDFLAKDIIVRSLDPLDGEVVESTVIDGGGVDTVVIMSAGTLSGFTIINGSGPLFIAGGVHATGTAIVTHNFITGNIANAVGGGVTAEDTVLVSNNQIAFNVGGNRGGGVNARDNALVINNFIAFNTASAAGGGIRARENCTIRNNTIVSNASTDTGAGVLGGGGILAEDNSTILSNVIAFSIDGVGLHVRDEATVSADYNCVFGNLDGEYGGDAVAGSNDVNEDPELDEDGLHLGGFSPCVNAGDEDLVPLAGETDIDGETRVQNDRVDIGADEREPSVCDGDVNGDGAVDPLDTGFILARFGCTFPDDGENCQSADANGDGNVDPLDTGYVLARFGTCETGE